MYGKDSWYTTHWKLCNKESWDIQSFDVGIKLVVDDQYKRTRGQHTFLGTFPGPSKGYVVLLKTEIVIGLITNLESKELYLVEYQQTGLP